MADQMFKHTVKNVRRKINDTLEEIPIIRTIKHVLTQFRGSRQVNIQFF